MLQRIRISCVSFLLVLATGSEAWILQQAHVVPTTTTTRRTGTSLHAHNEFKQQAAQILATGFLAASLMAVGGNYPALAVDEANAAELPETPIAIATPPPAPKSPPTGVQFNVETDKLAKSIEENKGQLNSAVSDVVKTVNSEDIRLSPPRGGSGMVLKEALEAVPEETTALEDGSEWLDEAGTTAAPAPAIEQKEEPPVEATEPKKEEAAPAPAVVKQEELTKEQAPIDAPSILEKVADKVEKVADKVEEILEEKKVEVPAPAPPVAAVKKEEPKKPAILAPVPKTQTEPPMKSLDKQMKSDLVESFKKWAVRDDAPKEKPASSEETLTDYLNKKALTLTIPSARDKPARTIELTNGEAGAISLLAFAAAYVLSFGQYSLEVEEEQRKAERKKKLAAEKKKAAAAIKERQAAVSSSGAPAATPSVEKEPQTSKVAAAKPVPVAESAKEEPSRAQKPPPATTVVPASEGTPVSMPGGVAQASSKGPPPKNAEKPKSPPRPPSGGGGSYLDSLSRQS
jgi:hypothetical protein